MAATSGGKQKVSRSEVASTGENAHIPANIYPLLHDGGMIYLNSETGQWGNIHRRMATVLLSFCGALESLSLDWRELHRPEPLTQPMIRACMQNGLLVPLPGNNPLFPKVKYRKGIEFSEAGVSSTVYPISEPRPPRGPQEKHAEQVLHHTLELLHGQSFRALVDEIGRQRGQNATPASLHEAMEMSRAILQVSDWYPGKFACMERTTATVLLAAQEGLHVDMQLSASVDPITYHAWPAVQGQAVRLSHQPTIGQFTPVFEV